MGTGLSHDRNGLRAQILVGPTGGLQRPTGLVLWLCLRPHVSSAEADVTVRADASAPGLRANHWGVTFSGRST
jgi:hypothetical protein